MQINKYNITLTRLKEADIELVREKRNTSEINQFMHFREQISADMQKKWFKEVNSIYHNYFIIHYNNKKIGLINGKNSDYEKRQSEGGMFIWDKNYLGTFIPALCSIMMSDFTFLINHFEKNYIKILNTNLTAISYNKQIGYVKTTDYQYDTESSWYVLTKKDYLKNMVKIRKGIRAICGDETPLSIDNINFNDDTAADFELLYQPLPNFVKHNINLILVRDGLATL